MELDDRFILFDPKIREITEIVGLARCHFGYHVWPGEPWDHCIRCFIRYPEEAFHYLGVSDESDA